MPDGDAHRERPAETPPRYYHTQHGHATGERELVQVARGVLRRLRLPWLAQHASRRDVLALFTMINGTVSIALIAAVAVITGTSFVFPSLGPTAFLFYYSPSAPAASPRNAICGQIIAVCAGVVGLALTGGFQSGAHLSVSTISWMQLVAATIALALTLGVMVLFNVEHPPAAATTLLIALGALHQPARLALLLLAVALLTGQAIVVNRLAGVPYPLWSPLPPVRDGCSPP